MTGHYQTAAHASTPTLCRETSAFLMKANYQRHILYGWVVALSVISIPTLMISVWPVEQAPPGGDEPVKKDTVSVVWDTKGFVVERDLGGLIDGRPPPKANTTGLIIGEVVLAADSIDIVNEGGMGPGDNYNEGPFGDDDNYGFGDGGDGGVVFVPDTTEYRFNSAELDRPPVLIAMDQPDYPSLAKRVEVEGKVLLHILVDNRGRVVEVRIEKEDNPGFSFGENAARAAWSAVFSPAIANRQPVRCWVAIPVEFTME